jgi:hypothetical protein
LVAAVAVGSSRSLLGWLAIPPLLLAFVLAGMAVATEPKEEFEERARARAEAEAEQSNESDRQGGSDERSGERPDGRSGSEPRSTPGDDGDQTVGDRSRAGAGGDQSQRPVVIQVDGGEVLVEFDENGRPTRIVAGEGGSDLISDRRFVPDEDGDFAGFAVVDGRLEPVRTAEFTIDDYWLETRSEGIEINRPDRARIQIRAGLPESEGGEVTFTGTSVSPAGIAAALAEIDGRFVVQPASDFGPEFVVDPESEPIIVDVESGRYVFDLQPEGDLTVTASEPASVPFGEASAVRLDEDGNFEVIPLEEISPDDTLLVPADRGFDLARPDGSRVEFRPDGENDGMTATEVSPDGQRRELEPNPDGSVTLDDGRTVGPIDYAEDGGALERLLDQTSDLPWPWVFGAIAALAALSIGTAVYLHRNRPRDAFDFSQFAVAAVPEDRFERFLSTLREESDATRAIRLAFHAVERGLAGLPIKRADETPFEWQGRVAAADAEFGQALAPICDLFALARFAPGEATDAERDRMIDHLRALNELAKRRSGRSAMAGV